MQQSPWKGNSFSWWRNVPHLMEPEGYLHSQ